GAINKLKAFHREFDYEVEKLVKPPALISNAESITVYFGALAEPFQSEIRRHLTDKLIRERDRGVIRRKDDPWLLHEVQQVALLLSEVMVGDAYTTTATISFQ
ncbi:hypothetical protein V5O48_019433, partial [Marasmius crinis-equi]